MDLRMAAGAPFHISKAPPFFLYMIPGVSEVLSEDKMRIYIYIYTLGCRKVRRAERGRQTGSRGLRG